MKAFLRLISNVQTFLNDYSNYLGFTEKHLNYYMIMV
jgi:hypothetical protein